MKLHFCRSPFFLSLFVFFLSPFLYPAHHDSSRSPVSLLRHGGPPLRSSLSFLPLSARRGTLVLQDGCDSRERSVGKGPVCARAPEVAALCTRAQPGDGGCVWWSSISEAVACVSAWELCQGDGGTHATSVEEAEQWHLGKPSCLLFHGLLLQMHRCTSNSIPQPWTVDPDIRWLPVQRT